MKLLKEFKQVSIVEEEKQDYSKFDALVRAGLANRNQIQRIHRILGKMGEEKPTFNPADRALMQMLFMRMTDLITNKQLFQKTKQVVREDYEELDEDVSDPPFLLVLKRKAIRLYPNGQKIALYFNSKLNKFFSVPYGPGVDANIQAEDTKNGINSMEESAMAQLKSIKDNHQLGMVKHKDGTSSKVDVQTAHAILTVHKSLNDENKNKFEDMVSRSNQHLQKAAAFSFKNLK